MRRPTTTQYNLEFPDDPVLRGRVARFLARAAVDPATVVVARVDGKAMVQFLAPKDDGLRVRLKSLGVSVREELIFQLRLPHDPGELHKLAAALAAKGINILSLYSVVHGDSMRIVLAVDQPANALALAKKLGYHPGFPVRDRVHPDEL